MVPLQIAKAQRENQMHRKLIVRNMRRQLRRTVLTALTIAVATFVFVVLVSVPASMDRIIAQASTTLRVVINNRTGPWYDLPPKYCNQVERIPGVVACAPLTGWPAIYQDERDVIMAFAAGPALSDVFPDYGLSATTQGTYLTNKRAAVVGELLMKKYHWKVGDEVTLRGTSFDHIPMSFIIAGVNPSRRYPNTFTFRRDYLKDTLEAHGRHDADLAWFLMARVQTAERLGPVIHAIDDLFHNSDYETRTVTESDAISNGLSAIGNVRTIMYSLSAVVLATVLLIAANAMAMMVRERLAEVALMRALGFSRTAVAATLLGESVLVACCGGILGAGVALGVFGGGVNLGSVLGGVGSLWVDAGGVLQGLGAAALVGLGSSLVPVMNAVRTSPALAFRQPV
jgi:putative ABC transport system permease protein